MSTIQVNFFSKRQTERNVKSPQTPQSPQLFLYEFINLFKKYLIYYNI